MLAVAVQQIHVMHVVIAFSTNKFHPLFMTQWHEFRTDREEKNHPLSRATSPYRPYKEILPGGELRGSVLEIS